ncbi:MAG: transcriptional regulator [Promethearchaeota archaeon]
MFRKGSEEKKDDERGRDNGEENSSKENFPEENPSKDENSEDIEIQEINLLKRDEIIKVPHRFNIMMILYNNRSVGFTLLSKILKLTPGNLDHHLKKLKELGWVENSTIFSYRPLSVISITEKGREIFQEYARELQDLLHQLKF